MWTLPTGFPSVMPLPASRKAQKKTMEQISPGKARRQRSVAISAASISEKNSIFVWKGLKYSIFNRISRTRAFSDRLISCWNSCRAGSRHYFNRRWLQSMPGTSDIEVASHPSQPKIRQNSKFQWWKIYYEENFKK